MGGWATATFLAGTFLTATGLALTIDWRGAAVFFVLTAGFLAAVLRGDALVLVAAADFFFVTFLAVFRVGDCFTAALRTIFAVLRLATDFFATGLPSFFAASLVFALAFTLAAAFFFALTGFFRGVVLL
jgi:hypothetical protein